LVKQALAISQASVTALGDEHECVVGDFYLFSVCDVAQVFDGVGHANCAERKALCTANDGSWEFVDIGRREDEYDVFWRLFERLE
jgi:hypothetical protein